MSDMAVRLPPAAMSRDLCHLDVSALPKWKHRAIDPLDLADTNNQSDQLDYAQYIEDDIPNYWQYARKFSLADHFFSSMMGPSFPGHMFVLAAQTGWALGNPDGPGIIPLIQWGCDNPSGTVQSVLENGSRHGQQGAAPSDF